jgi:ATP-dependent Clp protease ATP-binding subunit ClpX
VNTTDILFICGGAFVGLDDVIGQRVGSKNLGFGADVKSETEKNIGEILAKMQPEDLMRYGMIPEFVGRVPVVATLHDLDQDALVQILTQPKNALTKQYQKFFEFEDTKLKFTDGALASVSTEAIKRKSGARGLRAILEEVMLDIMYDLPSQPNVRECIINEEVVSSKTDPILLYESGDGEGEEKKEKEKKVSSAT